MGALKEALGFIGPALGIAAMFYTWLTSRSVVNSKRLDGMEDEVATNTADIRDIKNEIKHLPDKDMVTELKLSIMGIEGTVDGLAKSLGGVEITVRRIDDYMREGGGK